MLVMSIPNIMMPNMSKHKKGRKEIFHDLKSSKSSACVKSIISNVLLTFDQSYEILKFPLLHLIIFLMQVSEWILL